MPPRVDRGQGSAWKSSTHSFLFLASFDQLTHLLTVCFTSQAQRDIIFELRRIAFDAESDPSNAPGSGTEKRKAMYTKDYKMLGFTVSLPDTNTVDLLPRRSERAPPDRTLTALPRNTYGHGSPGTGDTERLEGPRRLVHKFMCNIWPLETNPSVGGPRKRARCVAGGPLIKAAGSTRSWSVYCNRRQLEDRVN